MNRLCKRYTSENKTNANSHFHLPYGLNPNFHLELSDVRPVKDHHFHCFCNYSLLFVILPQYQQILLHTESICK